MMYTFKINSSNIGQKVFSLLLILFLFSCQENSFKSGLQVHNADELNQAIRDAKPGDEIVMTNGEWQDVQIRFVGYGTDKKPITLRAETPGQVIIQGTSNLKMGGEYLVVSGLFFTNGHSGTRAVIDFEINKDTVANHCRVTNCVIKDFNKPQRNMTDIWVQFRGRHNQLDHCYISGKANTGPTVRVDLEGNQSIKNYHKIINNHFGPRPPKGGPSAETIQLGNSYTSMAPSYTLVADNLFERCDGEVEIISSKTNFNEFRNNVFYKSEGSLVTRHGNYCTIDGNYFIGDDQSEQIGGIRLIGSGHWVTNNYFYNLNGKIFRSPLAVMNGIPQSSLNRYIQVTDVVIAHNSWINCVSPWQFGVGTNIDQKEVLPESEIRSARPIRTLVANNLIYNQKGDNLPVFAHDTLDGISFKSNIINNQGVAFNPLDGLESKNFGISELEENIWVPDASISDVVLHKGFEFDQITKDLFGSTRKGNNVVGAINGMPAAKPEILNIKKYGPDWYSGTMVSEEPKTHPVTSASDMVKAIAVAKNGDIIELSTGNYEISTSLKMDKSLTIRSADSINKATILYVGEAKTPAFEMNPKGQLTLKNVIVKGTKSQYAFASLKNNMSSPYNINVIGSEISDFDFILKA
ncbi:MAG: chondroitinase-B domain-containing protein, partial [Saprospiraceae bacterium]